MYVCMYVCMCMHVEHWHSVTTVYWVISWGLIFTNFVVCVNFIHNNIITKISCPKIVVDSASAGRLDIAFKLS